MPVRYQVVYWRGIPAQIRLREGKSRASRALSPRFQEAIDQAAMRAGMAGTDAYLGEWRTSEWQAGQSPLDATADALLAELEQQFTGDRLRLLVMNKGLEPESSTGPVARPA